MSLDTITNVAEIIIALAAVFGIFFNIKQQRTMMKQIKTEVFIRYCSKYPMNKEVSNVVKYLEEIEGLNHNSTVANPDGHDVEIFMRFFEEIEYHIRAKIMDEQMVYDMFSYYLFVFEKNKEKFNITDYDSDSWSYYRNIVKRLENIKRKREKK